MAYAPVRQTSSRVWAAMVAAVRGEEAPEAVCALAGEFHAVGDLAEGRLDPVAPFGDDFQQGGGHGGALLLIRGDEHGGAAGGSPAAKARPLNPLSASRSRGRPSLEQVVGDLALVHRGWHDGPGADDPAAQVRFHGEPEAVEPLRVGGVAAEPGGEVVAGPVQPSGPRTRDGCRTGSAEVSTCWQSSSGSRAASVILSCSNAPHSQRVRRLASLWCGGCGNRWLQSRATSARNPASLRRPSRCRTSAIASSSASLQAARAPDAAGP